MRTRFPLPSRSRRRGLSLVATASVLAVIAGTALAGTAQAATPTPTPSATPSASPSPTPSPTSTAPAVVTDLSSDFEDGTTQGWFGAGVTVAAADSDSAHGGGKVLAVTDGDPAWGAPMIDLASAVTLPGVVYTVTGWVRLAPAEDGSATSGAVSMTVKQDDEYLNSGTYQVPVTSTGWTKLSRSYTLPEVTPGALQLYFQTADDVSDFQLDDVTVTHEGAGGGGGGGSSAQNLSFDFEDGTAQGWAPRGSVTLEASDAQANGGTKSLLTSGRTANWNGPALDLMGKVTAGSKYAFTSYVRMATLPEGATSDKLSMTMQATVDGTDSYSWIGGQADVTADGWTKLTGTWTAPAGATGLTVYVEAAGETSSYYLDDVTMVYQGGTTPPPLPEGLVQVKDFGDNPSKLGMYVHVPEKLQAKAPLVVASHYCTGSAASFYTGADFGVGSLVAASDRLGFIIVFPEATREGHCFDSASPAALTRDGGSDPVSVKSMVDYAKKTWTIDSSKVFAVGASSGAMFTQVLLGNYPDVFAAGTSFMGVPHSCFATGTASNLWNSDCAEGKRDLTGKEWGDLVRAANPDYTGPRPRVQLWHGVDDDVISYENLGESVEQWTNVLGVSATPAATTTLNGTWTRTRYGRSTVEAPVEAISVAGLGHELPKADMGAYVLAFFGLDAEVPDPTEPGTDGVQTLVKHDFENASTQGWAKRGGDETVTNSGVAAHTGSRSLLTSGRTQNWNAPVLDLFGKVKLGQTYQVSAWVKLAAGAEATTANISMERRLNDTPSYEWVSSPVAVTADGWTQLKGSYTLASDVDFLKLYVETPGTPDFFVDDVLITYLPAKPIQEDLPSLKDVFKDFWPRTGAATSPSTLVGEHGKLLAKHFNSVTPGNEMKWESTERVKGTKTYGDADALVAWAQANKVGVYGHVLAWHSQMPDWVFQDDEGKPLPVNAASKKIVLDRLAARTTEIVTRYKGKIYAWDAANEVISDSDDETYRNSKWYQYTGLDFIRTAFRTAHAADPNAKLCINDYNTTFPVKRAKYLALVKQLLAEGVPLDCVGHQMHLTLDHDASQVEPTLAMFRSLGVRQRITELDISVYDDDTTVFETIPQDNLDRQQAMYRTVFDALLKHAKGIDSVTLWGLADDNTWLSTFPITRLNTPLLFDAQLQAKPVFNEVVEAAHEFTPPAPVAVVDPPSAVLVKGKPTRVNVSLSGSWCLRSGATLVAVPLAKGMEGRTVSRPLTLTDSGTFTATFQLTGKSAAGGYTLYAQGTTCDGAKLLARQPAAKVGSLKVLAATSMTVDASPEPVRPGATVKVKGQLKHLVDSSMKGFGGAKVMIEFRVKGSDVVGLARTVTTGADGSFSVQLPQTVSGTWQARFAGDGANAPSSAGDLVIVKAPKKG
ncbi:MAG: PHB depolymerase family esterase [Kineosporiaceae bacterium]